MRAPRTAAVALGVALSLAARAEEGEAALGRKVFTEVAQPPCMLCHSLKAAGAAGTIGPSLDELKPDEQRVVQALRKGVGVMPSYTGKLDEKEIEAVAQFVAQAARGGS